MYIRKKYIEYLQYSGAGPINTKFTSPARFHNLLNKSEARMEFENIFGQTVRQAKAEVATQPALHGAKFTGIYFGAHWAPPCRLFTKTLQDFYGKANESAK